MKTVLILLFALLFSGCVKEVKPWEKETLSSDMMRSDGNHALTQQSQEHVYYSNEASRGGSGIAGGGCGCN